MGPAAGLADFLTTPSQPLASLIVTCRWPILTPTSQGQESNDLGQPLGADGLGLDCGHLFNLPEPQFPHLQNGVRTGPALQTAERVQSDDAPALRLGARNGPVLSDPLLLPAAQKDLSASSWPLLGGACGGHALHPLGPGASQGPSWRAGPQGCGGEALRETWV